MITLNYDAIMEDVSPTNEMTEQEYLQTCNTEQLAEFLSNIEEQYPCGALLKWDVTCGYHSQCRGDDVAPTNKEAWVEWLKQPHSEVEK